MATANSVSEHDWEKTDLVSGGTTNYHCKKCRAKGVRYGVGWPPKTKAKACVPIVQDGPKNFEEWKQQKTMSTQTAEPKSAVASREGGTAPNGAASAPTVRRPAAHDAEQQETVHHIALDLCEISEQNTRPRPTPKDPGIQELAKSIETFGQTTPGIVREHPKKKGHYEIGAGARRRVACDVAGEKIFKAVIRKYTDDEFEELILIENLQREDPDPRQEVKLLDRLAKRGITTTSAISAHLGKPEHWVARRLKLLDVIPEIRKLWDSDRQTRFSHFSVEMMELIGALPKDTQQSLIKQQDNWWLQHANSRTKLQQELEKHIFCRLASAPFDLNDKRFFVKGCGPGCASDSSKQGNLFDMSNGKDDARCLNCACFQSRLGKWRKVQLEELRKKHGIKKDLPLLISDHGYHNRESIRVGDQNYTAVTPDYGQKIVFEDPKKGEKQPVYVTNKTGTTFRLGWLVKGRESSGGGSRSSKPKLSSKESRELRKKMLEGKRWSRVHDRLHEALMKSEHTDVTEPIEDLVAVFGLPQDYHAESHDTSMPGSRSYKDRGEGVYHWKLFDERKKKGYALYVHHELYEAYDDKLITAKHRNAALWSGLKIVLAGVMKGFFKVSDAGDSAADMRRVAKLIKFDINKAKKEVDLEIPPPKTWGKVDVHTLEPLK